jgi:hypothetical protein
MPLITRYNNSARLSFLLLVGVALVLASSPLADAQTTRSAQGRPAPDATQRAARWRDVTIPFHREGLTSTEQQIVAKLADACRLLDEVYWRQSDLEGLRMYRATQDPVLVKLFGIMGSRWDLLDDNAPFIGNEPMPPGHELYPHGLTQAQIDQYVKDHPEAKDAIYNSWTVVKGTPDHLTTVPYHEAYAEWLKPMAADLRAAAKLTTDSAFAHFLNLRADSLLTDDYYASDVAWLDMKNPKIDIIFAPYESYLDDLMGVKTSYGAAIMIRNEPESRKLALYQQHEAEMQRALPIPDEDKPSKEGQATPMEVVDAPLRAGDLRYGYQAVADNLPNDARIHAEKGSKKMFFKNFMDERVNRVILPIAAVMMDSAQARQVTGEGYLTGTILHEVSHGLGPAFAHIGGKQVDIREAIGPTYSGLEEAKADVTGLYLSKWLVDQKLLPPGELEVIYASYVAGYLRTLRFGVGEAHGRAEMMEFNYLAEQGAITQDNGGRYHVDYPTMTSAIAALAKKLLMFEAEGDRAGAEAWFAKYDVMPASLTKALEATKGIPVDIAPHFDLSEGARP